MRPSSLLFVLSCVGDTVQGQKHSRIYRLEENRRHELSRGGQKTWFRWKKCDILYMKWVFFLR